MQSKFHQISASLIAASTVLTTAVLPVMANPFSTAGSSVFRPGSATLSPGAIGNVLRPTTPPTSGQAAGQRPPQQNGNGELQGLGDHQSWVDTGVLANDARALCSDVGLGNNTSSSQNRLATNDARNTRSSETRNSSGGGGGGFNVLGIVGANGSGQSSNGSQSNNASDIRSSRNEDRSNSTSTVVVGRNCDAFVESAAARDMNHQDNLTERYRIRVGRRGEQVDGLLQTR